MNAKTYEIESSASANCRSLLSSFGHFCGGEIDEFDKCRKGLSGLSTSCSKRKKLAQQTLQIDIDEEAFDRFYGHISRPIPYRKGRQVAVRVISQFGEESTKVLTMA